MRPSNARRLLLVAAAVALTLPGLLSAGCGGSGGGGTQPLTPTGSNQTATGGRAIFSVRWPEREPSRLVPLAADSIKITLKRGDATVAERVLARPPQGGTSDAAFENLALGDLTANATDYPNADGTGTAQATATVPVKVQAGDNTPLRLTMASTVASLQVAPTDAFLTVGQSQTFTATAKNVAGEVVLILPQTITWSSSDPAVATVDGSGNVSARASGATTITATETESGKSASASVTVSPASGDSCGAVAARYTVVDLGMPEGTISGNALELNDQDEAVCIGTTADNKQVAYLSRGGQAVVNLGVLLPGPESEARGINDQGQFVLNQGRGIDSAGRSYVWDNGALTELPLVSGYHRSWAAGINNHGVVAGMISDSGKKIPVCWRPGADGKYVVDRLDYSATHMFASVWITGINDAGQITGYGYDNDFRLVGMLWEPSTEPGGKQYLLPLPTSFTSARTNHIGESGLIVGLSSGSPLPAPTLWRNRTPELLPLLPGHAIGYAFGVNRCGLIAGASGATAAPDNLRATLSVDGGPPVDLNTKIAPDTGWILARAHDVNDRGHVVGIGIKDGKQRAFLLIPR
ncbi:MAG TPA: Ig-like domain-containing protein [Armatimonadaceae bacterium]|nr:Ig-like domain-containing protein [Armatimonadaceae bacterium]